MLVKLPMKKGVYLHQDDDHSLVNSDYAARLVNLLIDDSGANFDRPALKAFATLTSPNVIGATYFQNKIVWVTQDRHVWSMDQSGSVSDVTGNPLPGGSRPVFAQDVSKLYIIGGGRPIYWAGTTTEKVTVSGTTTIQTTVTKTKTTLLDGSPPIGTHIAFVDGFLIINDQDSPNDGNTTFRWSAAGASNSWPANNFASAEGDPDPVISLLVNQREVLILGTRSLEFWTNVGDLTSPFQRVFILEYGTSAPYSPIVVDNSLIFLDHNRRILRVVGRTPQHLSQPIIKELESYSTVADCFSFQQEYAGKTLVVFVFPTAGKAWCHDLTNGNWAEWASFEQDDFTRLRVGAAVYVPEWARGFAGDYQSGNIWSFDASTKTDAGNTFSRLRRFSFMDQGLSVKKRTNKLRLKVKRGIAKSLTGSIPEVSPMLEMRYRSDNDVWSNWSQVSLGKIGDSYQYAEFNRLGIYRSRQYEMRVTDPASLILFDAEEDVESLLR